MNKSTTPAPMNRDHPSFKRRGNISNLRICRTLKLTAMPPAPYLFHNVVAGLEKKNILF
jgi:hypothetical protein